MFVFFFLATTFSATEKLHIGIFIESECRYSKQFITNQFKPAYKRIKGEVDIEFFTFGKSESFLEKGEIKFKCQHGPEECRKNKFQTCGLHLIGDEKDMQGSNNFEFSEGLFYLKFVLAEFIVCTMGYSKSYRNCAEDVNLNYTEVKSCAEGSLGTELQLDMEENSFVIKDSGHVPTITFDHKYDAKVFFSALDDFGRVVENELEKKKLNVTNS